MVGDSQHLAVRMAALDWLWSARQAQVKSRDPPIWLYTHLEALHVDDDSPEREATASSGGNPME